MSAGVAGRLAIHHQRWQAGLGRCRLPIHLQFIVAVHPQPCFVQDLGHRSSVGVHRPAPGIGCDLHRPRPSDLDGQPGGECGVGGRGEDILRLQRQPHFLQQLAHCGPVGAYRLRQPIDADLHGGLGAPVAPGQPRGNGQQNHQEQQAPPGLPQVGARVHHQAHEELRFVLRRRGGPPCLAALGQRVAPTLVHRAVLCVVVCDDP